jgi:hypothetical protein
MKSFITPIVVAAALCGCSVTPKATSTSRPPTARADAIAKARLDLNYDGTNQIRRLELPAQKTGTGLHDFYSLFARFKRGTNAVYGVGISTAKKLAYTDTQVTADGAGPLMVEARREFPAPLGNKLDFVQAVFTRNFLERSATNGARLQVTNGGGSLEFSIPHWMFAALLEASDENDWERTARERREHHVALHPELPQRTKDAVLNGQIILRMSAEDARASWGEPKNINRTVSTSGVHEQWVYGNTYVYFEDGVLTSWQESR